MNLGQRLLDLRKSKGLSQEEVAELLNVTRQTISKWETDQSTPDFDKILPLCELFEITPDELLTGEKKKVSDNTKNINTENGYKKVNHIKRARGIGLGILTYFISIVWIMITIPVMKMNPIVSSAIFILICGIATFIIIYTCMVYKSNIKQYEPINSVEKQIKGIFSIITTILYLLISINTNAWHITWILWVVYGLICQIIKLIFMLRGETNEK